MSDGQGGYQVADAAEIMRAARELASRKLCKGAALNSPALVRECLPGLLGNYTHERFAILFLDSQNRLIAYEEMFRGSLSAAAVHPREIVKEALAHNAASVILAHNHPSGSLIPSEADIHLTRRIQQALELIEVQVNDHFIATGTDTVSMAEKGLL